jgi:large subunit ribosomal protein L25
MIQTELNVKLRTEMGKKSILRELREDGFVPAVCYGALKESVPVYVSAKELKAALSTEAKEHVLLNLKTDKKSALSSKIAILKDITKHPIKRSYIHADFQILDMKKPIKVTIGINLLGKAKGLIEGGILDQVRRTVDLICLPADIPSHVDVDVSELGIGDSLHVSDLEVPKEIEILTSKELTIAVMAVPVKAKEAEEVEEGEVAEEGEAAEQATEE